MDCFLNRPTCKRTIMEGKGQFRKETCPVLEKPKCLFAPQQCPLLPEENGCTINKVIDIIKKGGCFANQPPPSQKRRCCCCCAQPEPEPENTVARCRVNRLVEMPPCSKCKRGINAPGKEKSIPLSKSSSGLKKKKPTSSGKKTLDKKTDRINTYVPGCTLNSRRPFPCADCLMQLLDCPIRSVDYDNSKVYCKARAVKCPFTQVIDTCDTSCLCSNLPAIDTGPKCPFLPEPCPCIAMSCPLAQVPPNPLVERLAPPPCSKPFCRCYCPVIPNPCSFTCPECPIHSGKVKCPLEQGNICPSMLAPRLQICYCVPVDSSKIALQGSADSNHKLDENGTLKNSSKVTLEVNHEVEVEQSGVESNNNQKAIRKDLTKKLTTKPGTQINYGKEQEIGTVLINENQDSVPSPKQEQYQKTYHRKSSFDQYTQSRSDQFPYFVDTKRGDLRTHFESKSEQASAVETTGALEGIEDYYDGHRDNKNPTTSDLYSTKSIRENEPGVCHCWSEYKRRRKLTNYPSIRTESLYKSTERKNDLTNGQNVKPKIVNTSRLAKMLPSPSTYVGTNVINKMDAPKLCKAPVGKPNINCHERANKPTTSNISEKDKEIVEQFANRISAKIESPEFRFFNEFIMCECNSVPQTLIVRPNECPCNKTTCSYDVDDESLQCGYPCGSCCPSTLSLPTLERTFHVPTCPLSRPLPQPRSPEKDELACPFSPNECPLGPYCLFPVASKYDPKSPKIPKTDKICFCQDQDCLRPPPTFESPCPLEKINHNKCVCVCQPPSCPLAQPEALPPVFRRCPFICPQNNDCIPPPITRLCKYCAQGEDCEPPLNEPFTLLCFCENASPKQQNSNKSPSKLTSLFAQNSAMSISKNVQSEQPRKFSDLQNKAPEVAVLPESLTKLLNEGKNEDNVMFSDFNCMCMDGMNGVIYEKANYECYKPEEPFCKCCPCAKSNKTTIKCPLNLENCPCLNLTQTNACPLNAIQCPVERPACPVKPILTPEIKPNEMPIVKEDVSKDSLVNATTNNPVNESETDLAKKSGKIEQTVEKKHVTSVEQKSDHLSKTLNRPTNQKPKADTVKSGPVKSLSTKKRIVPSNRQKLLGGSPKCMLEKPKCPLTGIKPAVFPGAENSSANAGNNELGCPVMNPPCELFPEGRCPMMEVGACNCNYPVAPCMAPAQCGYVNAPPQYCYKEDCCMGLTLPPIYPAAHGKYDTGFYYKFMDWKPGEKTTKHYIEISEEPPPMDFFNGHEFRQHDNWWILREGKGYEQCKKVQEIIEKRGPVGHRGTQFDKKDNPLDIETQTIMENRKNREEKMYSLETTQPSWKD